MIKEQMIGSVVSENTLNEDDLSPMEAALQDRWDKLSIACGSEPEGDKGIDEPNEFMSGIQKRWKEKHKTSKWIDSQITPYQLISFILSVAVEQREQLTNDEKNGLARCLYAFAQKTEPEMPITQKFFLEHTILNTPSKKIGPPKNGELALVRTWIGNTSSKPTHV